MAFVCAQCGKSCRDNHALKRHQQVHTRERACPHCNEKILPKQYDKHLAGHSASHHCVRCDKYYKNYQSYLSHILKTHRSKVLKCKQCRYKTRSKARMKTHVRKKHAHATRRACEECGDSFRTLGAYLVHRRQHVRGRENAGPAQSFRCAHCRGQFNSRLARTAHMTHCGRRRRVAQRGGRGGDEEAEWESEFALAGAATIHKLPITGDEETKDVNIALISYKQRIIRKVTSEVARLKGLKFWLTVRVGASRETADGLQEEEKFLRSQNHIVLGGETGEQQVEQAILQTVDAGDKMINAGSSWQITACFYLELNVVEYAPLGGSSYIPLPLALRNPRLGIVNIMNKNDSECFRWCVLAKKHPARGPHAERLHHYRQYYDTLQFGNLESENFKIKDIPKFEKLNDDVSFTVVTANSAKTFYPLYSSYAEKEHHVTLLYITKKKKGHYCLVRNLDSLLYSVTASRGGRKHFCKFCFNKFPTAAARDTHQGDCREDGSQMTKLPPEGSFISFDSKMYHKTERCEFVLYYDFECYMQDVDLDEGKKTRRVARHRPFCYALLVTDEEGKMVLGPFTHAAEEGVVEHFISKVLEIEEILNRNRKDFPLNMTPEQWEQFDRATHCDMCKGKFQSQAEKVPDHDHMKERANFRAALHGFGPEEGKVCNALRRRSKMLTCVAHNNIRYDNVLLWHGAVEHPALRDREIKVIPRTKSSYLSFSINLDDGRGLVFIDSYRHVMGSLEAVGRTVPPEDMHVLKACFKDDATRRLIQHKSIYFYEYVKQYSQFSETELPPREAFHSRLTDSHITQQQYEHAQEVYRVFKCENLLSYSLLYVVCDTAILADLFSSYRRSSYETFQVDAAKFVSGASLSWACALRKTGVKIQNITDVDQFRFVEKSIRGGQSFVSTRYAKANNQSSDSYDPQKPTSHIAVLDLTSLYGGTMQRSLPYADYSWVDETEYDLDAVSDTSEFSYFWMIDAEYPRELHYDHREYPLAPEKLTITEEMLSPAQRRLLEIGGRNVPKKEVRLVAHLGPRRGYVCHALLLKEYVARGLKVTKVHKGLKFRQKPILKEYLDHLVQKRAAATSQFEQMYFKLAANSIFGYTLKSTRHHINVKIARSRKQMKKLARSPFFHSFSIFGSDLIAVQMKQNTVKLDYPVAVGASILEISKLTAYQTYFSLKEAFGPESKQLLHDTDSWAFQVNCASVEQLYSKVSHLMDFSNLPADHPMFSNERKKVPLYLKDEYPAMDIHSFVGLRAKCYAIKFCSENEAEVKKCKGVMKAVAKKQINYLDYKRCLFENYEKFVRLTYLRDDGKQRMYTWEAQKSALFSYDGKRYLLDNGRDTVPFFYDGPAIE